jgi:hypothetical protein
VEGDAWEHMRSHFKWPVVAGQALVLMR